MGEYTPSELIGEAAANFNQKQGPENGSNHAENVLDSRGVGILGVNDKIVADSRLEQLTITEINEHSIHGLFCGDNADGEEEDGEASLESFYDKERKTFEDLRKFILEKSNIVKIVEAGSIDRDSSMPMDGQHFILLESRADEVIQELKQEFGYDSEEFPLDNEIKLGITCDNEDPWPKLIFIYAKERNFE